MISGLIDPSQMRYKLPAKTYQKFEEARRSGLKLSDQLRIEAKVSIGYLLNDKTAEADKTLNKAAMIYAELMKLLKDSPYLHSIGGVHVGTEEYVEACLLADYLEGKPLRAIEDLAVNHEAYIGGLCDMSGELLRYGRKHPEKMKQIEADLEDLHQNCLQIIVSRNNVIRKKLGDLERNTKHMEEMIYQWELKK